MFALALFAAPAFAADGKETAARTDGTTPTSLQQAYAAAWQRQPEAHSLQARQEADAAAGAVAGSWLAKPPELELTAKTDRMNENHGAREYEAAVAMQLWLPGERGRAQAVAGELAQMTTARQSAAQLRTAGEVREAYWSWRRAQIEHELARDRLRNARAFAADVARRVRAGDLARADLYRAEAAAAAAEGALAERIAALATGARQLQALTGIVPVQGDASGTSPNAEKLSDAESERGLLPGTAQMQAEARDPRHDLRAASASGEVGAPSAPSDQIDQHPLLAEPIARLEAARRQSALARVQGRGNPQVVAGVTRERGRFGEAYEQAVIIGLRIPFGSDGRYRNKVASANAEEIEASRQLQLERERVAAAIDAARQRVVATRAQRESASRRLQLASDSRGFFDKSFKAGETDFPTRLQVEFEAAEAEREAARAQLEHGAAISGLHQALGLLP